MTGERVKWFDAGNVAHGFVAIGNVATGFIAIGNVARGVIAIGNLAVGVVAAGNVGFGMLAGAGATVGVGLFSVAGVMPLGVLGGVGGLDPILDVPVLAALVPIVLWGVASWVGQGRRSQRELPRLTPLSALRDGSEPAGWALARLLGSSAGTLRLRIDGERLTVEATANAASKTRRPRELLVSLHLEERAQQPLGYREQPPAQAVLVCDDVAEAPPVPPPWQTPADVQWMLGRAWRVAAVVGLLGWLARLLLAR